MKPIVVAVSGALVAVGVAGALAVVARDDTKPVTVADSPPHAAVTNAEGPRILADWLPNAKWRYPAGAKAMTDAVVLARIKDVRLGKVRDGGDSSASAPTQTVLLIVEVERQLGGEELGWTGDTAVEVTLASSLDGAADTEAVESYRTIGRALLLLKTREVELANPRAKALVYWDAGVASDGRLVVPATGRPIPPNITRGLITVSDVERQLREPSHEVDPADRRRDPTYFEGTEG